MVKIDRDLFRQAKKYLSGGVNSPVRSFKAVGGLPVFIKRGQGAKIYSEEGKEFIDYCQSYGALILGHSHPEVVAGLRKVVSGGTSFGAATKLETQLAQEIIGAIPSIEKIRLTNSGTEAVMGAIRLARAYTQRNKIIKFAGSYHGHADYLLDCPGVPDGFKKYTLTAPYNNIKKVKQLVKKNKDIAAIIVEPVAANMGLVLPEEGFLPGLRKIADSYNIVLIFDEVITGFRLCFGAAQKLFGIKADLTCLGKIIGGGLAIGAFGGRKEIMGLLAPQGPVYQAGTFSGNPLATSAGLATLKILAQDNPYARLEKIIRQLSEDISNAAEENGLKARVSFISSMFSIFFADRATKYYNSAGSQDRELFKKFYQGLLKEGIYFSPSCLEANFISTAHKKSDLEKTLKAVKKVFSILRREKC